MAERRNVGRARVTGDGHAGERHVETGGGSYTGHVHTRGGDYHSSNIDTGGGAHVGGNVSGSVVGRDQIHVTQALPHYTLLRTGRVLAATGALIACAGFAMFAYFVLNFITVIFQALTAGSEEPDMSGIKVVPYLPLGFGLFVLGIFIVMAGMFFIRRSR